MKKFLLCLAFSFFLLLLTPTPPVHAETARCYSDTVGNSTCFTGGGTCSDPAPSSVPADRTKCEIKNVAVATPPPSQDTIQRCITDASGKTTCSDPVQKTNPPAVSVSDTEPPKVDCIFSPEDESRCTVEQSTFIVNIIIKNIQPPGDKDDQGNKQEYFYCLKEPSRNCDKDDLKSATKKMTTDVVSGTSTFTLSVCGKGKEELKTDCDNDGSDWFWPGRYYTVTLYDKKSVGEGNIITEAFFNVTHLKPEVIAPTPSDNVSSLSMEAITKSSTKTGLIPIKLAYKQRPKNIDHGGNNVYFVAAVPNDYGENSLFTSPPLCVIPGELDDLSLQLPLESTFPDGNLKPGPYKIIIKEASIDTNAFQKDPTKRLHQNEWCHEGEFTYYHIPFEIGAGNTPGKIGTPIFDPFEVDKVKPKEKLIKSPPICSARDPQSGYCTSINTALGIPISTQPELFVRDVFRIVLGIGGIAALLFFIRAGYTLMTSAGNKEKVGAAREQITAAIMGLVFIILSMTILEFIGIDILQIPGLTR